MMKQAFTMAVIVTAGICTLASQAQSQDTPARFIEHVKGDVYLFSDSVNEWNTPHGAMFVVTPAGIVVTDPITADAVDWLKGELAERFDVPVTHMIYSHSHSGHNSGGQNWGDELEVISHSATRRHIEAGETETALPTMTFETALDFSAGGKQFEARHLGGSGHSEDLIAVVVRPENVSFVVDLVTPKRLPLANFPHTDIAGMVDQLKAVEALDFDLMVPGHGPVGTKQDVTEQREYIETLMMRVRDRLEDGETTDQIAEAVTMPEYQDWWQYEAWIEANVRGMTAWLQGNDQH